MKVHDICDFEYIFFIQTHTQTHTHNTHTHTNNRYYHIINLRKHGGPDYNAIGSSFCSVTDHRYILGHDRYIHRLQILNYFKVEE